MTPLKQTPMIYTQKTIRLIFTKTSAIHWDCKNVDDIWAQSHRAVYGLDWIRLLKSTKASLRLSTHKCVNEWTNHNIIIIG